jgi:hypothetical protein
MIISLLRLSYNTTEDIKIGGRTMNTTITISTLLGVLILGGCKVPQSIKIDTNPSPSSIRVNGVYIGDSPTTWRSPDIRGIEEIDIIAERLGYNSARRVLVKGGSGYFPEREMLILQPTESLSKHTGGDVIFNNPPGHNNVNQE